VIVMMGSGARRARDGRLASSPRARRSASSRCASTGRSRERFVAALPASVQVDRGARPHQGTGRVGEPLYLDVVAALREARDEGFAQASRRCRGRRRPLRPLVEGVHAGDGARGLRRTQGAPKRNHFTVGIVDDVTHLSLPYDARASTSSRDETSCARCSSASGADGTVGANKNSIKIIGEETDSSRRATSSTTRRSRARSRSRTCASARGRSARAYLVTQRQLRRLPPVRFLERYDVLERAAPGATFLLNSPTRRTRSGTSCRARCRRRSSRRSSSST
jgi:pyruvate-ferredoxin/flavodoxin oxidoreductase